MWKNALILSLSLWNLCSEVSSGNGTKRCRPLADDCISMRSGFEPVKLIVGSPPTNRFLKIGGISSFSDVGHSGLTEFVDSPEKVAKDGFTPDNTSVLVLFRSEFDSFQVDHDLLVSHLLTSSKLRDNIVTFVGYILYKPNDNFTFTMYRALELIYESFKSRLIYTTELLSVISDIKFENAHNQFLILLTKLEETCPVILKCSVKLWKEALLNKQIDINQIVSPDEGPSLVDLLSGIDIPLINEAKRVIDFGDLDESNINTDLNEITSPLLKKTLSAISAGSLSLTQPMFAMIMSHLPAMQYHPEVEEASRFLIDTFKDNYVKSWENISDLEEKYFESHFGLVREILKRILNSTLVMNFRVQEAAAYLLPAIITPTKHYMNEYQPAMTAMIMQPKLDIGFLLSYLDVTMFAPDIADCKVRIIEAIHNNILEKYSILFGFMRFQYSTPEELFISISNRIRRRYFDLDSEVMDSVKSLNAYISFRNSYAPFSEQPPKGFFDVVLLFEAFFSPSLPKEISSTSKRLAKYLEQEALPWNSLLIETKFQNNVNPRSFLIKLLRHIILKNLIYETSIINLMKEFLSHMNEHGEPLRVIEADKIDSNSTNKLNVSNSFSLPELNSTNELNSSNSFSLPELNFKLETDNDTKSVFTFLDNTFKQFQNGEIPTNILKQIYYGLLNSTPIQQNSYYYDTIKLKLAELEIDNKKENEDIDLEKKEEMEALPDYAELSHLLPHLESDENDTQRNSLVALLNSSNLPVLLGPTFKPSNYTRKADLLTAVLENLSRCHCGISNNNTILKAIKRFSMKIHIYGIGSQKINWKCVNRKVDFTKLLEELIDYDNIPDEIKDAYDYFAVYITNGTTFNDLILGFNSFVWKNKHDYTVGVMKYMTSNNKVPDTFVKNVLLLIPYVKETGVGEEQPEYQDIVNGGSDKLTAEYKKDVVKKVKHESIVY